MEKAPHEEYRDDLADKLNKIRNSNPEKPEIAKAIAKGYLEATKNNLDYRENRDDDEDGMLEGSRFYRVQKARWEKILPKLMEKQAIELKEYNYKLDTLKRDPVIGYLFESAQVIPDGDNLEFNTDKFDRNGNFVSKGLRFEVSLNKRIEIKGSTKEKEDIFFMEKEKEIVEYLDKLLKNADRIPNWLLKLYNY